MTAIRVFALFLALSSPLTLAACGEDDERETEHGQQDDEDDNDEDDD